MKSGILLVNKPKGLTSHDVINKVRKVVKQKKLGHSGTLDPNATGLLVLFLGNATKYIPYVDENHKEYIADIIFGYETDTDDITGNVTKTSSKEISLNELNSTLDSFIGKYDQLPPMYSARKVKGKKLYEYARKGEEVEVKPKEVEIKDLVLLENKDFPEKVKVLVKCSKGTYIRSLARDIGQKLGTLATMGDLNRVVSGEYNLENAIDYEKLDDLDIDEFLIPLSKAFNNIPTIILREESFDKLKNGNKLFQNSLVEDISNLKENELVQISLNNDIVSIGFIKIEDNKKYIQPKKVFLS